MKNKELNEYIDSCNDLAKRFADNFKLEFDKDSWIGNRYDVIEMSDYYIDITTIFLTLKHNVTKETFIEWYNYTVSKTDNKPTINYNSWIMGLRPETIKFLKR